MVKFNDKGQGYWSFILENCSDDLIASVEKDLNDKHTEILSVKKESDGVIYVYLETVFSFIVYIEIDTSELSRPRYYQKQVIYKNAIADLKELGVI